jgi:hypothetical protein
VLAAIEEQVQSSAPVPACLWQENPYRLVSLWDMLRFNAHEFVSMSNVLGQFTMDIGSGRSPQAESSKQAAQACGHLERHCEKLNLPFTLAQLKRIKNDILASNTNWQTIRAALIEVNQRLWDELESRHFLAFEAQQQGFYETPLRDWETVVERFSHATADVEEASKCYALERYPASIFHLMRVTEAGVLELGKVVDPQDHKPQFSSVLKKIDNLVQKTKWPDWPEDAKPNKQLFIDVLPRLYAVKDSWRDKASHFEGHIIPTDTVSNRERALDVYNSTLSLMRLLAERLA